MIRLLALCGAVALALLVQIVITLASGSLLLGTIAAGVCALHLGVAAGKDQL